MTSSKEALAVKNAARKNHLVDLAWQLIEYKIAYYYPELIRPDLLKGLQVPDSHFDQLTEDYLKLCIKLGIPNTVCHSGPENLMRQVSGDGMMEVDFTRPCVHLIMRKYGIADWQKRCSFKTDESLTPVKVEKVVSRKTTKGKIRER